MDILLALLVALLIAAFIDVAARNIRTGSPGILSKKFVWPFSQHEKVSPARRSPYRATSIVNSGNSCSAVKRLLNLRFLDLDKRIPAIPVVGCNIGYCNCAYAHHADRRDNDKDRRTLHALSSDLYQGSGKINRRKSKGGRRKNDLDRLNIHYSQDEIQTL